MNLSSPRYELFWRSVFRVIYPPVKGEPILYWGNPTPYWGGEPTDIPLRIDELLLIIMMTPAYITHELAHYITAKLLGFPIRGVVLLRYSHHPGCVYIQPCRVETWRLSALLAAPLLINGPIALTIIWLGYTGTIPGLVAFVWGYAFAYQAIPDQLRDVIQTRAVALREGAL